MAYEQRDNAGSLFKNADKGNNEKAPDYRGPCMVDGKELEASAWLKTSKDGKTKFMSLSFKPPFKKKNDERPAQRQDDDDIPF